MGQSHAQVPVEVDMATKIPGKAAPQKKKSASLLLYEKKIEACRERIRRDEETIASMEHGRGVLMEAGLVGLAVTHRAFGAGTVIGKESAAITVKFDSGEKRFMLPSAFTDGFLTTADDGVNLEIARYQDMGEQIRAARDDIRAARRSIRILESKL